MAKTRVLILFGGTTGKAESSQKSAAAVMHALPHDQYEFVPVGITAKGRWLYFPGSAEEILSGQWAESPDCSPAVLSPDPAHNGILVLNDDCNSYSHKRVDVIFPCLRSRHGEDGAIQGLCDMTGIPYTGNGILGSAVCRNKAFTHKVLQAAEIRTPLWRAVYQRNLNRLEHEYDKIEERLAYPICVKPSGCDGSAVFGVAKNRDELAGLIKLGFTQDNAVLTEELILGREFRVGVFGYDLPFASYVGEVCGKNENQLKIPAALPDDIADRMRKIAIRAFCVLDCKGLALFDFYFTAEGEILLGEVNTMPELTEISPYPLLMADLGMRFPYLIEKLIEQAIDHADRAF